MGREPAKNSDSSVESVPASQTRRQAAPGERVVLGDVEGPGTVRHLSITFPPMPFRRRARILLTNHATRGFALYYQIAFTRGPVAEDSGRPT